MYAEGAQDILEQFTPWPGDVSRFAVSLGWRLFSIKNNDKFDVYAKKEAYIVKNCLFRRIRLASCLCHSVSIIVLRYISAELTSANSSDFACTHAIEGPKRLIHSDFEGSAAGAMIMFLGQVS